MEGVLNKSTMRNEIDAIIRSVDADNSGTIDFDEFLTLMSDPKFKDATKDERRQVFETFDKDGSGHISVAELKEAFHNLGQLPQNFPSQANLTVWTLVLLQARDWMTMSLSSS